MATIAPGFAGSGLNPGYAFRSRGEQVELLAERALHWPAARTLFVADVHLGKAAAFRAGGVAIPRGATASDLERLSALLARTGAARLVVLGDFLHAAPAASPRSTPRSCSGGLAPRRDRDAPRTRQSRRAGRRPVAPDWGVDVVAEPHRSRRRSCCATNRTTRPPATRSAATCIRACASPAMRDSARLPCFVLGGAGRCCRRSGA